MDHLAPTGFYELADAQCQVATRRQLRDAGVSEATVRARLDGERWRGLNDRVVILHNGPLTRDQQLWAVARSAEAPIALCALTVLETRGLRGHEVEAVHVLVQRGNKVLPTPGIAREVHESRRFDAQDILHKPGWPQTSLERAAVDAAAWSPNPRAAARVLTDVIQQRLTTADRLLAELGTVGAVRYRRLMSLLLVDIGGGAHALSELEFLRFCRRHGFPRPTLQWRRDSQGRRRYLDARFKRRDGRIFTVEVDGGIHLTLLVRWKDTSKDNDDVLDRRTFLRFPSVAIYLDDPVAVAQIRRALDAPMTSDGGVAIAT